MSSDHSIARTDRSTVHRSATDELRLVPDHDDGPLLEGGPSWPVVIDGTPTSVEVSIVIPCRNEALNLPAVLPQIPRTILEVVVVDGGSTDDTVAIARELRPDVVIVHQLGKGKGDALRAGFLAARGDIIVMLDADGSMSPREIGRFVEALAAGADLVKGSRHAVGGGSSDLTALRHAGNRVLSAIFNRLFGAAHTDLCYGYLAFWTRHLDALLPDCDGFEVETLLNIRAVRAELRIAEVPSHEGRRIYGQSNLRTFRDGARVLRTLTTEWVAHRREAVR